MNARLGGGWDRIEALPFREEGLTTAAEQDRFYLRKVFLFLREDPGSFLRLQIKKSALLFNHREVRATIDPEFHRRLFRALRLPLPGFALSLGLATAGTLSLRLSRPSHQLLLIYLCSHAITIISTVVSSRYRLPFTVGLILLAGAGAVELALAFSHRLKKDWKKGERGHLFFAPFLFLLGVGFSYLPGAPSYSDAEEHTYLGLAYAQAGDLPRAESYYRKAVAEDHKAAMAMIELAWLEFQRANYDSALAWQRKAIAADPDGAYGHFDLAQYLWVLGRKSEALQEFRKAVECKPLWEDTILKLAEAELQLGLTAPAHQRLHNLRLLRPDLAPKIDPLLAPHNAPSPK